MPTKTALFSRNQTGGMFAIEDQSISTGSRFFVDSVTGTDGAGYGQNPTSPTATIDYANGLCTANKGDIIYVMPNHAESITATAGLALDVVGVSVIGLGRGTDRPTITFTTATTADIEITAANVTLKNLAFVCDIDALAGAIDVTAAWCRIEGCDFTDLGADNCVDWITLSADADYAQIINCVNQGTATAGNDSFVTVAAATGVEIIGLKSQGDFAAANIELTAAAVDILVADCYLENANAVDVNIEGFAAATGWIARNSCRNATDAQVTWINTGGELSLFENYGVNNDGETGLLVGTASA